MSPAELCTAGDELKRVVGDMGLSVLAKLFPWDLQVETPTRWREKQARGPRERAGYCCGFGSHQVLLEAQAVH